MHRVRRRKVPPLPWLGCYRHQASPQASPHVTDECLTLKLFHREIVPIDNDLDYLPERMRSKAASVCPDNP